jgi:AbrB family looped-hinge helix DNA binding protein
MGHDAIDRETITIGRQGRIVIPARMREALALREGQRVTVAVTDGELHISTVHASIARARSALGITEPRDPSLPGAAGQIRESRDAEVAAELGDRS